MRLFVVSRNLQHHFTKEGYGKNSLHCLQIEAEPAAAAAAAAVAVAVAAAHRSQLLAWEKLL
jgi:hypothetical protein